MTASSRKKIKVFILRVIKFFGGFKLARFATRRGVRILCYHGIWRAEDGFKGDSMFMSVGTFKSRMEDIRRLQYPVISLASAVMGLRGQASCPNNAVVITIDDGWFSTFSDMLPILLKHELPATLYCDTQHLQSQKPILHVMARYVRTNAGVSKISGLAKQMFDRAIDTTINATDRLEAFKSFCELTSIDPTPYFKSKVFEYMSLAEFLQYGASPGQDIQLHTHRHTMHDHSETAIKKEISDNREALVSLLSVDSAKLVHFCYPSGDFSIRDAQILETLGILSSTTTRAGLAYANSNFQLLPRILDGEQLTGIEFEAELAGLADLFRNFWCFRMRY